MKYYFEVAPISTVTGQNPTLTYVSDEKLLVGQRVRIPIGRQQANGVVWEKVQKPSYATKPITKILDGAPLPAELLKLAEWLADYYATPLPVVLQTMLPTGLHKQRRAAKPAVIAPKNLSPPTLNSAQQKAVDNLKKNPSTTRLLHGVTGSGKTLVYITRAKQLLEAGKSSIILVPEIGLTSQLITEFEKYFDNIFLTHSRMTESERHQIWNDIASSTQPAVIVGPRSALFSPVNDLGLIVLDEFHEPSFRQDQNPKYSAVRAAAQLSKFHKAQLVLGSATPSVSDMFLATQTPGSILELSTTFKKVEKPTITILNLKKQKPINKSWINKPVKDSIQNNLLHRRQTMIFHNRRGSASSNLCKECGWTAMCPNCFLPLTLHADWHQQRCHICDYKAAPPTSCPVCQNPDIVFKGLGTKQIEADLRNVFPGANVARFDNDNAKSETLDARYDELKNGTVDIIVGTQTIAKGLDLPRLGSVIIPLADLSLYIPDYTASERTFQLLHQVVGRVGRHKSDTEVIVQTFSPDHPAIKLSLSGNYRQFYDYELEQRRMAKYPPFVHLMKLTAEYASAAAARSSLETFAGEISSKHSAIQILGPAPSFHERFKTRYRWQIVIKARSRQTLLDIIETVPQRYLIDLDPVHLL